MEKSWKNLERKNTIIKLQVMSLLIAMPVSPSYVSWISVFHFRNYLSLVELWFVWRPALKTDCQRNLKARKPLHALGTLILFESFLQSLLLDPCFLFHHLVSHVFQCTRHFENSSALLFPVHVDLFCFSVDFFCFSILMFTSVQSLVI